jgi:hypothetical protein
MSWKNTSVSFKCFGLDFEAEVKVYPGYPGSREQPPEGPEMEFVKLTCEGSEADYLLKSEHLLEELDAAAWNALNEDPGPDDSYGPEDLD